MKRLMLLFITCSLTVIVLAQGNVTYSGFGRAEHAEDTSVVRGEHGVGWVRSHFFDEWFFELQGGGQLFYGADDRLGPLQDRLTGNAEFQFGRRIFPMFGFRLGLGRGYARGFLTKEHHAMLQTHGGDGVCGTDALGNPLGGYYWEYSDDLLIQKWKYFYFGIDLFLDLDMLHGSEHYNPYRRWNNIVYLGSHVRNGLSETDTKNHRIEGHVGYIGKLNINRNLSLFADLRLSGIENVFDREWIPGVERYMAKLDWIVNAQIGILYKFHFRTKEERDEFVITDKTEIPTAKTKTHVSYYKMEQTFSISIIDTLYKYQQINNPTPETRYIIDSLQAELDDELARNKKKAWEQPLDSIFLNQLLPYEMVFFELDKWDVLETEETKIDKIARIMKAYPDEKFLVTGSADSQTGTVKRNQILSHNRADVVYNMLITEYGVNPDQLIREYLGGIDDYKPFYLNRCTVIIMDHPAVKKAFDEMKQIHLQ